MGAVYRLADALRRRHYGDNHGRWGEDVAHRYLRGRGCTIVARNYRTAAGTGEIDLVAWHGARLAFIEVKTRATSEFGEPERAVDFEKQQRIERAARDYARRAGVDWQRTRFDIVSVVLDRHVRVEWIQDAFQRAAATL